MTLRKLFYFFFYRSETTEDILLVELRKTGVGCQSFIKLAQKTVVVYYIPEILAGIKSVNARNGLQKIVAFKILYHIQNRVSGSIKTGKQLVDYYDYFRVIVIEKMIYY